MPTYGVTTSGFVAKTLAQCKAELEADYRDTFGQGINVEPQSVFGQIIGIHAEREADFWAILEDVYRAFDPDANEGDAQDAVAAITGARRAPARKSTVEVTLTGTPGTVVPAGSVASVFASSAKFELTAQATIGAGGTVSAVMESQEAGPVAAPAGTLTVIETPVAGWTDITNPTDATLGALAETAAQLRVRREAELRSTGAAAVDAVRADVLQVPLVTACTVFENVTGAVDGDGLPAKSIEVLVSGGDDQAIRDAIWKSKGGGIETYGSTTGTALDSQGTAHTIKFSRPVDKLVYLDVSIKVDAATYPADGDAQIISALAARTYSAGEDVVSWQLKKLITVSGVLDVPALEIGLSAWPASEATMAIGSRELAKLDSSRVRVTHL